MFTDRASFYKTPCRISYFSDSFFIIIIIYISYICCRMKPQCECRVIFFVKNIMHSLEKIKKFMHEKKKTRVTYIYIYIVRLIGCHVGHSAYKIVLK